MYKVTNQQLYSDIRQAVDGAELNEHSAEEMYSAIHDTLQDQEGFTEELIEKCASVAFDAVNDLYSQSQGIEVQSTYSNENLEYLFAAEDQELYATWVGRGLAYLNAARKGLGAAIGNTKRSYINRLASESSGRADRFGQSGKSGFWSRMKQTAQGHMDDVKDAEARRNAEAKRLADKIRSRKNKKAAGGILSGFRDNNGNIMGLGKRGEGITKWAKDNKGHAAAVGVAGAAAVGGASYLAYRAYKKRKAAQAAQQQNATHQVQPNVQ